MDGSSPLRTTMRPTQIRSRVACRIQTTLAIKDLIYITKAKLLVFHLHTLAAQMGLVAIISGLSSWLPNATLRLPADTCGGDDGARQARCP